MAVDREYQVAFAAAVLAAAAFIIALLQALLQYISSSESRNKCTRAAIGSWRELVNWRWSFRDYRMKFYYPSLDMRHSRLFAKSMFAFVSKGIEASKFARVAMVKENLPVAWSPVKRKHNYKLRWWHITDRHALLIWARVAKPEYKALQSIKNCSGFYQKLMFLWSTLRHPLLFLSLPRGSWAHIFFGPEKWVTIWDLSYMGRIKFIWYRLFHPLRNRDTPRASWAQILQCLGIDVDAQLKLGTVDADTISAYLDTPTQRVSLFSLGTIAFYLGFHSVEVDVPTRTFTALSPWGTITTEEVPALGKILRFEGDDMKIVHNTSRCHPNWTIRAVAQVNGRISFGMYIANGYCWTLGAVRKAAIENLSNSEYALVRRIGVLGGNWPNNYGNGPVFREALLLRKRLLRLWEEFGNQDSRVEVQKEPPVQTAQSGSSGQHISISHKLEVISFKKFLRDRWAIIPSYLLHDSFSAWQEETKSRVPTIFASACFNSFHAVITAFPSTLLLEPFLPWVKEKSTYYFKSIQASGSVNKNATNFIRNSSLFSRTIYLREIPYVREDSNYLIAFKGSNLSGSIMPNGLLGWGIADMNEFFTTLPERLRNELGENLLLEAGPAPWEVNAVLATECVQLLGSFELREWAEGMELSTQTIGFSLKPLNMLWTQLVFLDMMIQYLIRGGWNYEQRELQFPLSASEEEKNRERILSPETWGDKEAEVISSIVAAYRPQDAEFEVNPVHRFNSTQNTDLDETLDLLQRLQLLRSDVQVSDPENSEQTPTTLPQDIESTALRVPSSAAPENQLGKEALLQNQPNSSPFPSSMESAGGTSELGHGLEMATLQVPDTTAASQKQETRSKLDCQPEDAPSSSTFENTGAGNNHGTSSPCGNGHGKQASNDNEESQFVDWDLVGHLEKNPAVFQGEDPLIRKAKCERLAILLELRAIFMVAFWYLHPDSSDVYLAEGNDIEMPMA